MEIKDAIYIIVILGTLIISIVSLRINLRNRRNGMREHLYKEQMTYFIALSKELHLLSETFLKVELNGVLTEAEDKQIDAVFETIDTLTEGHEIITPEEIRTSLRKVFRIAYAINLKVIKGPISIEDMKLYNEAIFELSDKMSEHLGIDRLSDENRLLSFGRLKLSE